MKLHQLTKRNDIHQAVLGESPRVLLLHPNNVTDDFMYAVPQVALGYLSAALKDSGYPNVDVRDAQVLGWSTTEVVNYVQRTRPDVIGIRLWSHQLNTVAEQLKAFRRVLPNTTVIVGGPHMTVAPEYVAMVDDVDWGIVGEAERSLPMLLDYLRGEAIGIESIPGLAWTENGELRTNKKLLDPNLDNYRVDWASLDLERYHAANSRTTAYDHGRSPNGFIFTTRGCPYPCTYCAAGTINGKKIREHSAARVMEDIVHLYREYGVRHFNIMDDNFTFYRDTVLNFCHEFLKLRSALPGVTFHNPNGVRVDRLDDEMLGLMAACGWKWLHIGMESASPRVLKMMKKRLKLEKAEAGIAMIRRHGMKCWGFFILGYPGETRQDMEATISWAIESQLTAATFSLFSPIPGTDVHKQLVAEGRIPPDYNMTSYVLAGEGKTFADGVDAEQLVKIRQNALLRFYSRPDRAYHLLENMDLATLSNRFRHMIVAPFISRVSARVRGALAANV